VITKTGPALHHGPDSDATLLEDVQELVFARARQGRPAIRVRAAETGTDALTPSEIEREIAPPARRTLKRRRGGG